MRTVRKLVDSETLSFDESVDVLLTAPGELLLAFDAQVRRGRNGLVDAQSRERATLVLVSSRRLADVYQFLHACDGNGHLRERALRALRARPGRLACAAALIRAEDWVTQVSDLAPAAKA